MSLESATAERLFRKSGTNGSNPLSSSEESCELSVPEQRSRKFAGRGRRYPHKYHHDPRRNADAQEHWARGSSWLHWQARWHLDPVPAVWSVQQIDGRWGIVFDRVSGVSFAEQVILAANGDAAQGALGGVIVEGEAAVVEAAHQRSPAGPHVAEGLGEFARGDASAPSSNTPPALCATTDRERAADVVGSSRDSPSARPGGPATDERVG